MNAVRVVRDRWRIALGAKRRLASIRSCGPLRQGFTVVVVAWNSLDALPTTLAAVRRFSPPDTPIVVVDNGSVDGSVPWLHDQHVRLLALDRNVGHGPGLDLGVCAVRTKSFVTLDVDAFPIDATWLERMDGLLASGAAVVGAHGGEVLDRLTPQQPDGWSGRSFVHPCCCAMRTRCFFAEGHTFRKAPGLDVGELISRREANALGFLEPTSTVGPGALGTVFGGVVYHNFYGTRHRGADGPVDGITAAESADVWRASVRRYLGAAAP